MRVRCSKISREFVESVVPDERTWRYVEHTIFGIKLLDGCATTLCVTFAKDLLKVTIKQFMDTVAHCDSPW
jgi:hypothetical protein